MTQSLIPDTHYLLLLLAGVVRATPWFAAYPLHRDEALYGFWARLIASGRDPLLLTPWIDKPPLVLYLLAGSLRAFGVSELALRLPGMIASLLTVWMTYGFARRAYGVRTAWIAAALVALSPFAILFAPTAFTDPWLSLWIVAAAWAALARRPFLAGLAVGLAVASKQQGVLGIPLVIGLLIASSRWQMADGKWLMADRRSSRAISHQPSAIGYRLLAISHRLSAIGHRPSAISHQPSAISYQPSAIGHRLSAIGHQLSAILGFALIFGPVTYWDSLRWVNRPSFWDRSLATYGGLYLAPLAQWPQRAVAWAGQLGYLWGLPVLSATLLLLAAAAGAAGMWRTLHRRSGPAETIDWLLAAYIAGYLVLHIIVTFQSWDRYLLPLVPLASILAARGIVLAIRQARPHEDAGEPVARTRRALKRPAEADESRLKPAAPVSPLAPSRFQPAFTCLSRLLQQRRATIATLFACVLALALAYAAWLGAAGRLPVGSDHGAYVGLNQVVATLRAQPADAIIYHRWLSWHYDFYLFDAPQERRWWGDAEKLVDDAAATARVEPGRPQWVVLPDWEAGVEGELRQALNGRGLALAETERIYRPDGSRSFTLFRIVPLQAEAAP